MSGYKRFIAYVYEYQKGKKSGNCGFIKVEIRNQRCLIELHLHCPGIPDQTECRTYGILRKDGLMNGIFLGCCPITAGTAECAIETDSLNMADSGIPFAKTGGIVLLTETGGFFGTEWDDQPVRPDNFREMPPEPESIPAAPDDDNHNITYNPAHDESIENNIQPQPNTSAQILSAESTEIPDDDSIPEKETDISETASFETQDTESAASPVSSEETVPDKATEQSPPNKQDAPCTSSETEFAPFDDLEFIHCQKIRPDDLGRISPRIRALRNNRFLQYGYYNFGHLLLAQRQGGRFILGVPGGYDQQERFMAGMFGFPYFKQCRSIQLPGERGGYWYRLIDAPNSY